MVNQQTYKPERTAGSIKALSLVGWFFFSGFFFHENVYTCSIYLVFTFVQLMMIIFAKMHSHATLERLSSIATHATSQYRPSTPRSPVYAV